MPKSTVAAKTTSAGQHLAKQQAPHAWGLAHSPAVHRGIRTNVLRLRDRSCSAPHDVPDVSHVTQVYTVSMEGVFELLSLLGRVGALQTRYICLQVLVTSPMVIRLTVNISAPSIHFTYPGHTPMLAHTCVPRAALLWLSSPADELRL